MDLVIDNDSLDSTVNYERDDFLVDCHDKATIVHSVRLNLDKAKLYNPKHDRD